MRQRKFLGHDRSPADRFCSAGDRAWPGGGGPRWAILGARLPPFLFACRAGRFLDRPPRKRPAHAPSRLCEVYHLIYGVHEWARILYPLPRVFKPTGCLQGEIRISRNVDTVRKRTAVNCNAFAQLALLAQRWALSSARFASSRRRPCNVRRRVAGRRGSAPARSRFRDTGRKIQSRSDWRC